MADGTCVGSIFLDLIVRDTVGKQVQNIAQQAQNTAKTAFTGMEKVAESAANHAAVSATKITQTVAANAKKCAQNIEGSIGTSVNKSVASAQARLKELENRLARVTADRRESSLLDDDKGTQRLLNMQTRLYEQVEAARNRLAVQVQIAEEKQAAAAKAAAQKAVDAEQRAASRRRSIHAGMWKNMLSTAGSAAKKLAAKILPTGKAFNASGKAASRFGSRLREIASGALLFNGLSAVLRSVTSYLGNAISSTNEMQQALANLKGAAANAAAPLINVLTPALSALANGAATVFSYISRLISLLTGKTVSAAKTAAKSAGGAASAAKKAARSLASFDEIQKLDSDEDDSSGGGGSGAAEPNYDFQGKSPFLDSLLAAIETGQWNQVGSLIAQKLNSSLASISWPDIHSKAQAWTQNLVDTLNGFIVNLDWGSVGRTIGNGLSTILVTIGTFFSDIDWSSLGKGFGAGLNDLFNSVDWVSIGQLWSDALISSMGLPTAFLEEVDWGSIGNKIAEFLSSVDWAEILAVVSNPLGPLIEAVLDTLWGVVETCFADYIQWAEEQGLGVADGIVVGLFTGIAKAAVGIWNWVKEYIVDPLVNAVKEMLGIHSPSTVFAEIGQYLILGLLNGLKNTWMQIAAFFGNALAGIQSAFSQAWNTVLNTVITIWSSIGAVIRGVINGIISAINGMIAGVVGGINSIIGALNQLRFTIPSWVPIFGGQSMGFNIGYVTAPQIPMLAGGGVITQPTLAMMGEYAGAGSNPEIVAPQSIIEETVAGVIERFVASIVSAINNGGHIGLMHEQIELLELLIQTVQSIKLDKRYLAEVVTSEQRRMARARGW